MKTLYFNGNIITMDRKYPHPQAVLTENERIIAVGFYDEIINEYKDYKIFDLEEKTMLPGFIDAHSHIIATAKQMGTVNLSPAPNGNCNAADDIILTFKNALKADNSELIIGFGYDNTAFADNIEINGDFLNNITQDRAIIAVHSSGHIGVFNKIALNLLNIESSDGVLKENDFLCEDVQKKIAEHSAKYIAGNLKKAVDLYIKNGITTAMDANTSPGDYELICNYNKQSKIPLDIALYVPYSKKELLINGNIENIVVKGVKLFLDGSPQGKTAYLSKPYYVVPNGELKSYCGISTMKYIDIKKAMTYCVNNKIQPNVHANGDEAIEMFINAYEKSTSKCKTLPDLRPVIVHCQTVREDQLDRIAMLRMIPSYFSDHVYYFGDAYVKSILGESRAQKISPLKSTVARGIPFTIHTDSPVVSPNIIFSIHNAVNRRTKSGKILGKCERVTPMQAIKAVTVNAAYQIFEDNSKGSISLGKNADFVLLDKDPLTVPQTEIENIKIVATIKKDKIIYID